MTFVWARQNEKCTHENGEKEITSISAPLVIKQSHDKFWLFTRAYHDGMVQSYTGSGESNWDYEGELEIRTPDTPGGASSSDGNTLLLVYRGYWRHHFLWYLWKSSIWYGNEIITVDRHIPIGNGRSPAVTFFSGSYWIFYSNRKHKLCSFKFSSVNTEGAHNNPIWTDHSVYDGSLVSDGKPCLVVYQDLLHVYYTYGMCRVMCIALRSDGSICGTSEIKTPGIMGSPTVFPWETGIELLFFRSGNKLNWWIFQNGAWSRAASAVEIRTSHAVACYYSSESRLLNLLCSREPSLLKQLDYYSEKEKSVLCQSSLYFRTIN